jgi:hypothetical protein
MAAQTTARLLQTDAVDLAESNQKKLNSARDRGS